MRYKILVAALLITLSPLAHADSLLAIAPLRLILSDAKTSDLLTLTNRSEKTRTYKVVLTDQVMNEKGVIVQADSFPYSAKRMLRFMPRQVTLEPGQRQNIRVMAVTPEGLADGDYHTHMIFEEQKPEMETEVSQTTELKVAMESVYSVGVPVIVQHGKLSSALKLKNATASEVNGQTVVNIALERTGNAEASGLIRVIDKASQANLASPRMMHAYHEVDNLTVTMQLNAAVAAGKPITVQLVNDGKILGEQDILLSK